MLTEQVPGHDPGFRGRKDFRGLQKGHSKRQQLRADRGVFHKSLPHHGEIGGETSFEGSAWMQAYLDASLKSSANGGKLIELKG